MNGRSSVFRQMTLLTELTRMQKFQKTDTSQLVFFAKNFHTFQKSTEYRTVTEKLAIIKCVQDGY